MCRYLHVYVYAHTSLHLQVYIYKDISIYTCGDTCTLTCTNTSKGRCTCIVIYASTYVQVNGVYSESPDGSKSVLLTSSTAQSRCRFVLGFFWAPARGLYYEKVQISDCTVAISGIESPPWCGNWQVQVTAKFASAGGCTRSSRCTMRHQ